MITIPFQIRDITDPKELFGRSNLLDSLRISAIRNGNLNIVGARRFGKTCVVKSFITAIKSDPELDVYPIFLDFKSSEITGTDNAFRYMISVLLAALYEDNIYKDEVSICNGEVSIKPSKEWEDIIDQLENVRGFRLHNELYKLVITCSGLIDKTILFIIDEYEFLFKKSLDKPEAFMRIRNLGSELNEEGKRFFAFWLVGSITWEKLCDNIGSPAANTITETVFIPPLGKEPFENWWNYEISLESNEDIKTILKQSMDQIYEMSGGVPYYGIQIAEYIIKNKTMPGYMILSISFQELIHRTLSKAENDVLNKLSKGPQNIKNHAVNELLDKGIIAKKSKNQLYIRIGLLKEFINGECTPDVVVNSIPESYNLVRKITKHIEDINTYSKNKTGEYIFKTDNEMSSWEESLRKECKSKNEFEIFISSMYKMFFERAKENEKGDLLPRPFKYGKFANCLKTARNTAAHANDSYVPQPGEYKRKTMLEIVNNGDSNEPITQEDYIKFQINFLKLYLLELSQLLIFIRNKM